MLPTNQHIFRLDIAMNNLLLMRILQRRGNLAHIADYCCYRQLCAPRILLTQRAIGGIVHHEVGDIILHIKFEHSYNLRMNQAGDGPCLVEKAVYIITG